MLDFVKIVISKIYILFICMRLRIKSMPIIEAYHFNNKIKYGRHIYYNGINIVHINIDQSLVEIIATIRHEIRHVWQIQNLEDEEIIYWSNFPNYCWNPLEADAEMYARRKIQTPNIKDSILFALHSYVGNDYYDIEKKVIEVEERLGWDGKMARH